jgi:hypothetical protein
MYPQYLQRLLRTEAHADTAYLTGVVVRVRNKTPSFRASFDALFTLATLDNGTTVYTHTPARPATFRADVAALLRGAAARGHVSKAVVVGALSGKPVPKPAKRASKPGKRGVLARLVRGGNAMPGTQLRPMCACCTVVRILRIVCAEPGVDRADASHDAAADAMHNDADDAMDHDAVPLRTGTDAQADAAGGDDAVLERTDAAGDAAGANDAVLERTDAADDAAGGDDAVLQRTDAQADAAGGNDAVPVGTDAAGGNDAVPVGTDAAGAAAGAAAGGGNAVPVHNGTGRSNSGSASVAAAGLAIGGGARKKVRTCLCMASVKVMAQVL